MKYDVRQLPLISNEEIARGIFDMRLRYEQIGVRRVGRRAAARISGKGRRHKANVRNESGRHRERARSSRTRL